MKLLERNSVDDVVDEETLFRSRWVLSDGIIFSQRVLYPFDSNNTWFGTFNQEHPLRYLRLKRPKFFYSFDSKSATNRWPLSVIYTLIEMIWGSSLASSIVNSYLCHNTFLVSPPMVKKTIEVLLRSTPFVDYALLGDDILITDKKVAN
uniref:Reverse transcriptase domain-containing protein n=1 Tax=Solanum lycopersicum TaxID=4081 RepID=A0A3Q7JLE2_SOLLC